MNGKVESDFYLKDERGKLVQLVHTGIEQVNILVSHKGVHRGGHFHQNSVEFFYVVKGSVVVTIHDQDGDNIHSCTFSTDDFFCIEPGEVHSMYFPEECTMVVMYDKWIEITGKKDIHPMEDNSEKE